MHPAAARAATLVTASTCSLGFAHAAAMAQPEPAPPAPRAVEPSPTPEAERRAPNLDGSPSTALNAEDPLAPFARFIGGRWKMTTDAGTTTYDTWHWGPGRQSIRCMSVGTLPSGEPWRRIRVFYRHPQQSRTRLLEVSTSSRAVAEGAVTFDGDHAEGAFDMYQTTGHRELALRWTFTDPDTHTDQLLSRGPAGFELMTTWTRVRVPAESPDDPGAAPAAPIAPAEPPDAPTPSALLEPFAQLLGRPWHADAGSHAQPPNARTRALFEYVPYADAIYGRIETIADDGTPAHVMDVYLYHHTGARTLRVLALSGRDEHDAAVFEGDATPVEGGNALVVPLRRHGSAGTTALEARLDRDPEGGRRQQVWAVDGDARTPLLDVRYRQRD